MEQNWENTSKDGERYVVAETNKISMRFCCVAPSEFEHSLLSRVKLRHLLANYQTWRVILVEMNVQKTLSKSWIAFCIMYTLENCKPGTKQK
jgi:hypothetical protein